MKTKFFVLISLVVLLALSACSGTLSTDKANVRSMNVTGRGVVYLTPDLAYINIGVHTQSPKVSLAVNDNNKQSQAVAAALKDLGIEAKDIQTSAFNVSPQQQLDPQGQVTGTLYVVDNTVYVTVRDLTKMSQILDAVVGSGANNINGITFDVTKKEDALSQARKLAIQNSRAQAEELATAAGVKLGNVISINVYSSGIPSPMFEGKGGGGAASASVPVSAGQLSISVDANIVYELK